MKKEENVPLGDWLGSRQRDNLQNTMSDTMRDTQVHESWNLRKK